MTHWDPAYDGNVPRWTVRCGFVHEGVQCSVVGVTAQKPDAPKAKRVKIFCPHHAREEGRTFHGRNKEDRQYVMCLSDADKKRAREDTIYVDRKKKKTRSPARLRKESVSMWLGSGGFEECNVFHSKMVLDVPIISYLFTKVHRVRTMRIIAANNPSALWYLAAKFMFLFFR